MPGWLTLILAVPVVTALIGWVTNWAAVKMIFYPARFVGVGPLGWQAILYKQGHKFATGVADMVNNNLITAEELASRFDVNELEAILGKHLDPEVEALCREVADELTEPGRWDALPAHVRAMVVSQIQTKGRTIAGDVFEKLKKMAPELLDIHALVYKQLSGENVGRLARLTKRIGHAEFKFIEIYGGVFGFIIGLAQVGVWNAMQTWWLMPIVGVIVGLVTNWLAIEMIFRPQEPTKYFGLVTYQGLFAKRQKDIARDYGETAKAEILTPRTLIETLTEGDKGEQLAQRVSELVLERIRAEAKPFEAMLPFQISDDMLQRAQKIVIRHMTAILPRAMPELDVYLEEKMDVQNTVESRLGNMPKDDFERVLRGIFEEDELTLIVVGGVLGGAVGCLQGLLVTVL